VAGWPAYRQEPQFDLTWVDGSTSNAKQAMLERIVLYGFATPGNLVLPDNRNLQFKVDFVALVSQFTDASDPDLLVQEAADLLFGVPVSAAVLQQVKTQFLLQGQVSNYYWTSAYNTYINDPSTMDPAAAQVPNKLKAMFRDMMGAAECQLH
jgi:hypothetical protein